MRLGILILKDLRRRWRDRQALLINIAMPLLLTAIMGFAFGVDIGGGGGGISAIPLAIVADRVPSLIRDWFDEQMRGSELFETTWCDSATADRLVRRGDVKAAIVLPPDLLEDYLTSDGVEVSLWKDPNSEIKAGIVEAILRRGIYRMQVGEAVSAALWPSDYEFAGDPLNDLMAKLEDGDLLAAWDFFRAEENRDELQQVRQDFDRIMEHQRFLQGEIEKAPLQLEFADRVDVIAAEEAADAEPAQQLSRNQFDHILPNFAVFFLLFGLAASLKELHREKAEGTLQRSLLAPIGAARMLIAKWLGAALSGAGQVLLLFGAGAIVFRVNLGPDPWSLLVVTILASGAGAAVFLLLAVVTRTERQMDQISTVLVLFMAMLGGTFVPIDSMPDYMQILARGTFTWWANSSYAEVVAANEGLGALGLQLAVLGGLCFVLVSVSLLLWRHRYRLGVAS